MKKKVLLMGKSGSGKTSMRSIIFANYVARETMRLGPTLDVEHNNVRFIGGLVLNLWDCGGQDAFYENYFESQRDHIFRNVELLIYVFDIESDKIDGDLQYYKSCLEAILEFSENANIFVLIHKMDLIVASQQQQVFERKEAEILSHSLGLKAKCFATSIWDETLYKAWSTIVYSLIPNIHQIEAHLNDFCSICDADEVVLFERATFLVISHATYKQHPDHHRFEKISNIIKQFKLSCTKSQAQFQSFEVRNSQFTAFIDVFTPNTYIMVITTDQDVQPNAVKLNISVARELFIKDQSLLL